MLCFIQMKRHEIYWFRLYIVSYHLLISLATRNVCVQSLVMTLFSKNSEFHGNLFARKKSHGNVMEISCPYPPNCVPFVL